MTRNKLQMTFDPNTIEHLGIRMYSTLPPVLAELIANAYDADARHVRLWLYDKSKREIIIEDDGIGMSFEDINDKFLRIGRNRRAEEKAEVTSRGRKIIGKKGLGKLSFFGIAHEIEVATKKDGEETVFLMKWEKIKTSGTLYEPIVLSKKKDCITGMHGTRIVLRKIQRKTDFSASVIADGLSKMFFVDSDFKIVIQHNSEKSIFLTNERRFKDLEKEVEWKVPRDIKGNYFRGKKIRGQLIATKKPIPPRTNMRGILLFSRKKMVNVPEYFSESTSSHFFSYLTGWLEVDFIDDLKDDVIATNRQSLDWDHPEMQKLREHLRNLVSWLERDWRKRRDVFRNMNLSKVTGINIPGWFDKLPKDIRIKVGSIIQPLMRDSELPERVNQEIVKTFHEMIPEYPRYHWRHLHPQIQRASEDYYKNGLYYGAFFESVKRYISAVRSKAKSSIDDEMSLMENVFQDRHPVLSVTKRFEKMRGVRFSARTLGNIRAGHRQFSVGVVQGGRHIVGHVEERKLRKTGLFTERDCLDALSLLSHLFYRLDNL